MKFYASSKLWNFIGIKLFIMLAYCLFHTLIFPYTDNLCFLYFLAMSLVLYWYYYIKLLLCIIIISIMFIYIILLLYIISIFYINVFYIITFISSCQFTFLSAFLCSESVSSCSTIGSYVVMPKIGSSLQVTESLLKPSSQAHVFVNVYDSPVKYRICI